MRSEQATTGADAPEIKLEFNDRPGLGGIAFANFFLSILTLGIYYFWGKTNVRQHIWSCTELDGDALEYTGLGKELFLGFLVILFVVILPYSVITNGFALAYGADSWQANAANLVGFLVILFLINIGLYRARRYRLSRTLWRGIRGSMSGSPMSYGVYAFGLYLLAFVSLGLAIPWVGFKLTERLYRETEYGTRLFVFEGRAKSLYGAFFANLFWFVLGFGVLVIGGSYLYYGALLTSAAGLTVVSSDPVGLIGILIAGAILAYVFMTRYRAFALNYYSRCLAYEGARFELNATGRSLIGLALWNIFITFVTLGIAAPFATRNVARYFVRRLTITGHVNFDAIAQSQRALDKTGEGIADAFDIDGF
jgi:uncharacterized membrane protein YjgN (DUF898 family)